MGFAVYVDVSFVVPPSAPSLGLFNGVEVNLIERKSPWERSCSRLVLIVAYSTRFAWIGVFRQYWAQTIHGDQ